MVKYSCCKGVDIMLPKLKILDEQNKMLRTVSREVEFPLSLKDKNLIHDALKYLEMSQIELYADKYHLRPGMGLAFIQLGVPKRIFVVVNEVDEGVFEKYVVINPKIISNSEELVYVEEGEGCLSVNRPVDGIVPRFARIKIEAQNEDGEHVTLRLREDLAVAFQHEMDHLDGILFVDRIDKKNPFKNKDKMRAI